MINQIYQFIRFGVVGVSNVLISYVIYILLVKTGINYIVANICGFCISILNAFYWNNRHVFKIEEKTERTLWKAFLKMFTAYAGTGLILDNLLLFVGVNFFKINEIIAPIGILLITIPINFIINKYWAFRKDKNT